MPIYRLVCTNKECDFVYENYKCLMEERNNVECPECTEKMKTTPVLTNGYVLDERFTGIKD